MKYRGISLPPRNSVLFWTKNQGTYTREHFGIKGKTARRYAKRLKVAAMKAAGHLKGDNTPFTI